MRLLNFSNLEISQILVSIYFSIVFFQSSIDKIIDRENNILFFNEHFKNTIIKKFVPMLLTSLAVLEFFVASLNALAIIYSLLYSNLTFIFYGLLACSVVLLMLLFGQRLAKDYVGAADITIYFILCIITIMSF
jgi:putative oxidoreductase|tara:strand:+ start:6908 stop:7309 length:402 start_codon:yes stop_codon:yes gene_type:complete